MKLVDMNDRLCPSCNSLSQVKDLLVSSWIMIVKCGKKHDEIVKFFTSSIKMLDDERMTIELRGTIGEICAEVFMRIVKFDWEDEFKDQLKILTDNWLPSMMIYDKYQ